jgi:molybdopterin biosynthesis enzyme MoaB
MVFRVAILTVSDTAFNKGAEYDLSGPLLVQKVEQHPDYALADSAIVPDEIHAIQVKVKEWVGRKGEEKVDWVITSGGACFLCARKTGLTRAEHRRNWIRRAGRDTSGGLVYTTRKKSVLN